MLAALLAGGYVFIKNHFLEVAVQQRVLERKTELFKLLEGTDYWLGTLELKDSADRAMVFDYGLTWGTREEHTALARLKKKVGDHLPTREFHRPFYYDGFVGNFTTTQSRDGFLEIATTSEASLEHDANKFEFRLVSQSAGKKFVLTVNNVALDAATVSGIAEMVVGNLPTASGTFKIQRVEKDQWEDLLAQKRARRASLSAIARHSEDLTAIAAIHEAFPAKRTVHFEYDLWSTNLEGLFVHSHMVAANYHAFSLCRRVTGTKWDEVAGREVATSEYLLGWPNESFTLAEEGVEDGALILTGRATSHEAGWVSMRLALSRSGEVRNAGGVFKFAPDEPGFDATLIGNGYYRVDKVHPDTEAKRIGILEGDFLRPRDRLEGLANKKLSATWWQGGRAPQRFSFSTSGGGFFSKPSLGLGLKNVPVSLPMVDFINKTSTVYPMIQGDELIVKVNGISTSGRKASDVERWMEGTKGATVRLDYLSPHQLTVARDYRSPVLTTFRATKGSWMRIAPPISGNQPAVVPAQEPRTLPSAVSTLSNIARAEELVRAYYANDSRRDEGKFLAEQVDDFGIKRTRTALVEESARYDQEYPFREIQIQSLKSSELPAGGIATIARLKYRRGRARQTAGEFLPLTDIVTTQIRNNVAEIVGFARHPEEKTIACRFRTKIGTQDTANTKGVSFAELVRAQKMKMEDAVKEIILMDRLNFYKFGKSDPEDEPADYFAILGNPEKSWDKIRESKYSKIRNSKLILSPAGASISSGKSFLQVEIVGDELRVTIK